MKYVFHVLRCLYVIIYVLCMQNVFWYVSMLRTSIHTRSCLQVCVQFFFLHVCMLIFLKQPSTNSEVSRSDAGDSDLGVVDLTWCIPSRRSVSGKPLFVHSRCLKLCGDIEPTRQNKSTSKNQQNVLEYFSKRPREPFLAIDCSAASSVLWSDLTFHLIPLPCLNQERLLSWPDHIPIDRSDYRLSWH